MKHRTFNVITFFALTAATVAILAMPPDAFTPDYTDAEVRRERAEARMCIEEHGPGVAVVRDQHNRTVCVPRGKK